MPLPAGNIRNLNEQPLSSGILEAGLDDAQFHSTTRMDQNLGKTGGSSSTVFPVYTFTKVDDTWPDDEPPAEVTNTVTCIVEGEGRLEVRFNTIADEAPSGVCVDTDHEEEREVMCIPESLEALVANLLVGGGVHEDHDKEHEMTSDATWLCVVDILCTLLSNLSSLDVNKVDIMSSSVDHGPEGHGICDLSMEPDVFVGREEPSELGTEDTDDISKHWDEDQTSIESQDKTGTTRDPDGESKSVQTCQPGIGELTVPSITKKEEMEAVEDDVES